MTDFNEMDPQHGLTLTVLCAECHEQDEERVTPHEISMEDADTVERGDLEMDCDHDEAELVASVIAFHGQNLLDVIGLDPHDASSELDDWLEVVSWSADPASAVRAYLSVKGELGDHINDLCVAPSDLEDVYRGHWESAEEFAEDWHEQTRSYHDPQNGEGWPFRHIDWTAAAEDLMQDFEEEGGHYFWKY